MDATASHLPITYPTKNSKRGLRKRQRKGRGAGSLVAERPLKSVGFIKKMTS